MTASWSQRLSVLPTKTTLTLQLKRPIHDRQPSGSIMRKVVHVGPCNAPGGMATVMKTLAEHPPEGWEAELLATYSSGGVWSKWKAYRSARRWLKSRLSKPSSVDVVHFHVASDWSWHRKERLIRLVQGLEGSVVVHLHSGAFANWIDSRPRIQQRFQRLTDHPRTALVVLNDHWREKMSPYTDRIQSINNPLPPTIHLSQSKRDPDHLLLLGRADPVKGHAFAESLITLLRKTRPDLHLSMTGRTHSDVEGVKALGWVEMSEKQLLLNTASVLLVPSTYEGQPMVALEALASGCPVVLSSHVPLPPKAALIAQHNDMNDWLISVNTALDHPMDGSFLRSSVDGHGVETVQKSWSLIYRDVGIRVNKAS